MELLKFCKVSSTVKVLILVLIAALIAAVVVLSLIVVRSRGHNSKTYRMVPGDTLPYEYSSLFCSKIELESNSLSGLCLLYNMPEQVPGDRLTFFECFSLFKNGQYRSWDFYLHNGSNIDVSAYAVMTTPAPISGGANTEPQVDFYFLEETAYDDLMHHHLSCDHPACVHKRIGAYGNHNMTYHTTLSQSTVKKYYFVVKWNHNDKVEVCITLSINRTEYDLSGLNPLCTTTTEAEGSCELETTFGHHYPAVIYVEDNDKPWDQEYDVIIVTCDPRWGFYIGIIVMIFISIIVLTIIYLIIYRLRQKLRHLMSHCNIKRHRESVHHSEEVSDPDTVRLIRQSDTNEHYNSTTRVLIGQSEDHNGSHSPPHNGESIETEDTM